MNRIPFYAPFKVTNGFCLSVPTAAVISCLLIVGFWLRIHNLGMLGLIVDEGHQALAVDGILKYGYPLVPSGIPYAWNILYIYIQSFVAFFFGVNEFSLRLPGVIFSVASIPMIYLFGRSLFNSKVGLLSAFLITFSVWEIEVSRYARAYAAYQFFYILSLFTFYKGFIKGEKLHQFLVPPIFILTYMLTPLGVTLLMAFFVPFFIDGYKPREKFSVLLWGALTAGGFYIYERTLRFFDSWFRTVTMVHTAERQPISLEGIRQTIKANFHVPEVGLLKQLYVQDYWLFLMLCVVLVTAVAFLLYQTYKTKSDWLKTVVVLPIIASCFVHQFGLASVLFCFYVLLVYRNYASLKTTPCVSVCVLAIFSLVFWFVYATRYAVGYFSFAKYFWDYPKLHDYFLQWMFAGWPRFTVLTASGLLLMGYLFLKDRTRGAYIFAVLLCLLLPLFASVFYSPYYVPRYVFHLYPLLIVVFSFMICTLGAVIQRTLATALHVQRRVGAVVEAFALVFIAVILSQDVYPSQALAASNRTYTSAKDSIKAAQSWESFHQDYKTPGVFVKAHMTDRDIVVVLGASHVASIFYHYIGRVDYVLLMPHEMPGNGSTVAAMATEVGLIHYATGSVVLRDGLTLERLLGSVRPGRAWILADFQTAPQDTVRRLRPNRVFTGQDARTSVYVIDSPTTDPHNETCLSRNKPLPRSSDVEPGDCAVFVKGRS
jgi:hypothetical protein